MLLIRQKFKELYLPESLIELKDGWCYSTPNLTKIEISPLNKNFTYFDGKFLLGKSDKKSGNFNVLLFARLDIKKAVIPSNIKIISPSAFENCESLETIEILSNSELQMIGNYAFYGTLIDKIFFPSTVSSINCSSFKDIKNLRKVKIAQNSQLKIPSDDAFSNTSIEQFCIPSSVTQIGSSLFQDCKKPSKSGNFKEFTASFNSSICFSKIKRIFIPHHAKHIREKSFHCCHNLKIVEFSENSELDDINWSAFQGTLFEKISVINRKLYLLVF